MLIIQPMSFDTSKGWYNQTLLLRTTDLARIPTILSITGPGVKLNFLLQACQYQSLCEHRSVVLARP